MKIRERFDITTGDIFIETIKFLDTNNKEEGFPKYFEFDV